MRSHDAVTEVRLEEMAAEYASETTESLSSRRQQLCRELLLEIEDVDRDREPRHAYIAAMNVRHAKLTEIFTLIVVEHLRLKVVP
jgi:hypothetical protein